MGESDGDWSEMEERARSHTLKQCPGSIVFIVKNFDPWIGGIRPIKGASPEQDGSMAKGNPDPFWKVPSKSGHFRHSPKRSMMTKV